MEGRWLHGRTQSLLHRNNYGEYTHVHYPRIFRGLGDCSLFAALTGVSGLPDASHPVTGTREVRKSPTRQAEAGPLAGAAAGWARTVLATASKATGMRSPPAMGFSFA